MLKTKKIGMFIDSENIPHNAVEQVINQVEALGNTIIKKAYGDFTVPFFSEQWSKVNKDFKVKLIQSNRSSSGKSSTDMAMAIDIMDTLYENSIDVYCITSGDSDFLPLVNRIKKAGKTVVVCAVEGHTNKAMITEAHFAFYVNLKETKKEKSEVKISETIKPTKSPVRTPVKSQNSTHTSPTFLKSSLRESTQEKLSLNYIKEKIEKIINMKKDKVCDNKLDLTFVSGTFGNHHPGLKYKEYGCSNFLSLMRLLKYKTEMDSNNKVYILL